MTDPDATLSAPQAEDATLAPTPRETTAAVLANVPGYEILGELGRGGMGVVYKARQVSLGRIVALKMILSGGHAGEAEMARFRTEAMAIARLQHPNIVQVFEIGEADGVPFFSLEYCAGGSLEARLLGQPQEPRQAATLIRTLAEAMHAAHQANVIHRDLKPANVLLAGEPAPVRGRSEARSQDLLPLTGAGSPVPKITDFGLAKQLDEQGQTVSGAIMGTPSYMAPEQADAKKDVGPAVDIYALGAILYECLTGRPPFRAATAFDTILQLLHNDPVSPRLLQPKVPRDLETIALKCLEKSPTRRYARAQELADDLGRFLADEPIKARRPGLVERGLRWTRKLGPQVLWTAGIMLALVTALFFSMIGMGLYIQSLMGELELTTDGPPMTAEVLDDRDRVTQRFRVPTADPVRLDPGSHRLRLSAPGWPSEDVNVLITTRGKHRFEVDARTRELWPAVEGQVIASNSVAVPLTMPGRTDLVVIRDQKLRRIDGRDGKETILGDAAMSKLAAIRGGFEHGVRGKGSGDIVMVGTDGTVSSLGDIPTVLRASAGPGAPMPVVLGYIPGAEGRRDLLVYLPGGQQALLERINGDGRRVWQQGMKLSIRPEITIAVMGRLDGEPIVVVADSQTAVWLNADTGKPLGRHESFLGGETPPLIADIDGDGNTDLVWGPGLGQAANGRGVFVVSMKDGKPIWQRSGAVVPLGVTPASNGGHDVLIQAALDQGGNNRNGAVMIERLSGRDGEPVWPRPAKILRNLRGWHTITRTSARAITGPDLDGDGVADLFVVAGTQSAVFGRDIQLQVRALSGSDGRLLWHGSFDAMPNYNDWQNTFLTGAPLLWPGGPGGVPRLVVPQSLISGGRQRYQVDVLDGGTGRVLHRILDAAAPFVADLDGDGLSELVYTARTSSAGGQEYEGTSKMFGPVGPVARNQVRVIRGTSPESYRWLGRWEPIHDLDGDGVAEILRRERDGTLAVADGATGKLLWPGWDYSIEGTAKGAGVRQVADSTVAALPPGRGDIKGVPALLVRDRFRKEASRSEQGTLLPPLRAVSARDGSTLWHAGGIPIGGKVGWNEQGQVVYASPPLWLDPGEGDPVVLMRIAANITPMTGGMGEIESHLLLLSARDGARRWAQKLPRMGHEATNAALVPLSATVAGPAGGRVLLTIDRLPDKQWNNFWQYTLQARRLSDGELLWTHVLAAVSALQTGTMHTPVVGVLTGSDEAVLVRDGPNVRAFEAVTGKLLWATNEPAEPGGFVPSMCSPPVILRREKGQPPRVCYTGSGRIRSPLLHALDERGKPVHQREINEGDVRLVAHHNLGLERGELLILTDTHVRLMRGGVRQEDEVWAWQVPGGDRSLSIRDVTRAEKGPATIIVRSAGRAHLYGVRASDGVLLWQLPHFQATEGGQSTGDRASVVLSWPGRESVAQLALPVHEGKLQFPPVPTRDYPIVTDDPHTFRPLPWASGELPQVASAGKTWLWLCLFVFLALIVLVIPYRFFCLAIIHRSYRWLLAWLVWLGAVAALVPLVYPEINFRLQANGPPMGLSVYVVTSLVALVGLLLVLPVWTLGAKLLRREMGGVAGLVLLWLLCGVGFAVFILVVDAPSLDADQRYSWTGWYIVALPGLLFTGALLFLAGVGRVLWRGVRRKRRAVKPVQQPQ